ncbi:hypothetical protein D3C80_1721550 [compost metagenome]
MSAGQNYSTHPECSDAGAPALLADLLAEIAQREGRPSKYCCFASVADGLNRYGSDLRPGLQPNPAIFVAGVRVL